MRRQSSGVGGVGDRCVEAKGGWVRVEERDAARETQIGGEEKQAAAGGQRCTAQSKDPTRRYYAEMEKDTVPYCAAIKDA
jgi:hypothetical protein